MLSQFAAGMAAKIAAAKEIPDLVNAIANTIARTSQAALKHFATLDFFYTPATGSTKAALTITASGANALEVASGNVLLPEGADITSLPIKIQLTSGVSAGSATAQRITWNVGSGAYVKFGNTLTVLDDFGRYTGATSGTNCFCVRDTVRGAYLML